MRRANALPAMFPISRDPPEGGTTNSIREANEILYALGSFQFLGIPPKGEHYHNQPVLVEWFNYVSNF